MRAFIGSLIGFLCITAMPTARSAEVQVMLSGGFRTAYNKLKNDFESRTGHELKTVAGASVGSAPNTVPSRLKRGEPADVVIVNREGLDLLVKGGYVLAGTEVDLGATPLALAVKEGAPVPDISSTENLKKVLLNAKSIGSPNSTSAPFIAGELMERLGIPKDADGKLKLISPVPLIRSGELEMAIAPMSELVGNAGVRVVGILPEAVQLRSVFSAGVAKNAQHPVEAKALIDYLSSREALPIIEESGLRATSR